MAFSQKFDMLQTQGLVMTPQLQQAIKLLQLSNLELSQLVAEEIEQNPLLSSDNPDIIDHNTGIEHSEDHEIYSSEDKENYENLWTNDEAKSLTQKKDESYISTGAGSSYGSDDKSWIETTIAEEKNLKDFLHEQLAVDINDPKERIMGTLLIDMLDEAGYVNTSFKKLSDILGCSESDIENVLKKLQKFDPPGIFARDLSECLSIQLKEKNRLDPAMKSLLDNLDLVAKRDIETLLKICEVDKEDLMDMVSEVQALNPKPAFEYACTEVNSVTPDVLMKKHTDGGWLLEINSDTLPKVSVQKEYYSIVTKNVTSKKDKEYLTEQMQSANWLIRAIEQRTQTILKVATEIVRRQDAFFENGIEHLVPMTLKDVAEIIGMHESTVSRVTNNKYIETPVGVFELKFFFSSSISNNHEGDDHSSESVKSKINQLVKSENKDMIYSDEQISQLLKQQGIDIARRTVAKYREMLNIPSSAQRKRMFKAGF